MLGGRDQALLRLFILMTTMVALPRQYLRHPHQFVSAAIILGKLHWIGMIVYKDISKGELVLQSTLKKYLQTRQ